MTRLVIWILVAVLLIGGVVWLARMNTAKPLTHIEKVVPVNALPN